jgi:hypothetical protein
MEDEGERERENAIRGMKETETWLKQNGGKDCPLVPMACETS